MIFTKSLSFQIRSLKIKGKNQINSIGGIVNASLKMKKADPKRSLLIEEIRFSLLSKNRWKWS